MSLTCLHNEQLTVTIDSLGAQLISIKDAQGMERIWQRDPAFWAGSAPILFPVAGSLRENCYYLEGERYEMPKHGYVRLLPWTLENCIQTEAVFLMTEKHPGFPFDYELRAIYSLDGNALKINYRVTNTGDRIICYGLGAHESYATFDELETYTVEFDEVECLANYELEDGLIKKEPVVMAEATDKLPLKTEHFAKGALVFCSLKSRGVNLVSCRHKRRIRVEFPQHGVLIFWTKPGAAYICIEPWINAPDYVDSDMEIINKPGCICLLPGQTQEHWHKIIIQ